MPSKQIQILYLELEPLISHLLQQVQALKSLTLLRRTVSTLWEGILFQRSRRTSRAQKSFKNFSAYLTLRSKTEPMRSQSLTSLRSTQISTRLPSLHKRPRTCSLLVLRVEIVLPTLTILLPTSNSLPSTNSSNNNSYSSSHQICRTSKISEA